MTADRIATFFRFLGILFLVGLPVALGVAYIFEGTVGAVIVMFLFAAALIKAFVIDGLRE